MENDTQKTTGYSFKYHHRVAEFLTEEVGMKKYTQRRKYFENKLARDKAFDNGISTTMSDLLEIAGGEKGIVPAEQKQKQFQAVDSMLAFMPALQEDTSVDMLFKLNTAEVLHNLCENLKVGNNAVNSRARGALQDETFEQPLKSIPSMIAFK